MELLTRDDHERLTRRLEELRNNRQHLSDEIAEARSHGDLKENAEYHAMREKQGMEEAEIRRLEEKLKTASVTDNSDVPKDMVFMGSIVKLRDTEDGSEDLYKIVGEVTGNFDADEIEVSASSPMGEALMKAHVGDTVKVDLPRGTKRFEILELR